MASSAILLFHAWNAYSSLLLGTILNVLLFRLVKTHSKGDLKEYRWAYYYFCALNMLLLCMHTIIQPVHIVTESASSYIAFNGIASQLSNPSLLLALTIAYLSCLNKIIISLALQFFDRYLLICRKFDHRLCRFAAVLGLDLLILGTMLTCLLTYFSTTEETGEKFVEMTAILSLEDLRKLKFASEFDQRNPWKGISAKALIGCMLFCHFIVIFCYWRIRSFLKTNLPTNGFHSNVKLIKEVTINLLAQAILPLFCQTTVIVSILMRLAPADHHFSSGLALFEVLTTVPYCWLPLLNPLITILTIRDYRNAMGAFIRHIGRSSSVHNFDAPPTSMHPAANNHHHQQLQLQQINVHRLSLQF